MKYTKAKYNCALGALEELWVFIAVQHVYLGAGGQVSRGLVGVGYRSRSVRLYYLM